MINQIIEQIKTIPGVRTAFQVDDRIVVDLEETEPTKELRNDNRYFIDKEDACNCARPIVAHPRHHKAGELNRCGGCRKSFRVQFKE